MQSFVVVAVVVFVVSSVRLVVCLGIAGVRVTAAGGWMEGRAKVVVCWLFWLFFFLYYLVTYSAVSDSGSDSERVGPLSKECVMCVCNVRVQRAAQCLLSSTEAGQHQPPQPPARSP